MSRAAILSPLGLYDWDNSIFDLMTIPSALNRETLINNLLAETAELEVLYPNPTVFKNIVGVWSRKQLSIWEKLYETTQLEYNPIENYNRTEIGSNDGTGTTTHTGTDTTTDTTTFGGADTRTENITHGGKDITHDVQQEGGTDVESTTGHNAQSGSDRSVSEDKKGHWVAAFDSTATGNDDGLVKQTRDQDEAEVNTYYGKEDDSTGQRTTNYGKSNNSSEELTYGKTENVTEERNYGQTIQKNGGFTHGEEVVTSNTGSNRLHAYGNIGVTTTQQMIQEEREIDKFNLYDIIIEEFKLRFCILIY